jgi:hypothetical protein
MTASVWFPDAFEGVPEGAIERLTRTARPVDRHGSCCLPSPHDMQTTCVHCRVPGALLVGHSGQYVITRHDVHTTPDGATEHQALWQPHTCTGEKP